MENKFRLGELFCGPGGLALGAVSAFIGAGNETWSIEHIWANDYDPETCATYRRNICPSNPESVVREDIRNLNIAGLSDIDAFVYGFPCNDFSLVGKQKGFNGANKGEL